MADFYYYFFYIWYTFKGLFIFLYILTKIIQAFYLWAVYYDKWWVALIPFGHLYVKRNLGNVKLVPLILLAITSFVAFNGFITGCLAALALFAYADYKFCSEALDFDPKIYAFIPFAKYVLMVKYVLPIFLTLKNDKGNEE